MFESIWKKTLSRSRISVWTLVAGILWLLSLIYRIGVLFSLARKQRRQIRVEKPVISVGNLSVGGTGKTPIVNLIARSLLEEGYKIGIVASGYGRKHVGQVVAPGYRISKMESDQVGDEPMMLATMLPEVTFAIDQCKVDAAAALAERDEIDVIVVDDGFQHRQLYRDIDIVVFDASVRQNNLRIFPHGILREPLSSLKRADIVIATRADFCPDITALDRHLRRFNDDAPFFHARFEIESLIGKDQTFPVKYLEDRSVFLFAGVGNFRTLRKQVSAICVDLDSALELSDHQIYDRPLLARIKGLAAGYDSDVIITTAKDWVKIGDFDFGREILYLAQSIDLDPGEEKLTVQIKRLLKSK